VKSDKQVCFKPRFDAILSLRWRKLFDAFPYLANGDDTQVDGMGVETINPVNDPVVGMLADQFGDNIRVE
jgi:hypothetical protein